jgi:hypothetical protein
MYAVILLTIVGGITVVVIRNRLFGLHRGPVGGQMEGRQMTARLVFAAALALWAEAALAAPMPNAPPCADLAVIHDRLADQGMELVARGVFHNGDLIEVMGNPNGDFAVVFAYAAGTTIRGQGGVFTLPPGTACIVDGGTDWEIIEPIVGEAA